MSRRRRSAAAPARPRSTCWPCWRPAETTPLYDQPTASELLSAVAGFLRDEVSPTLSGRLAFHARVAVNVLEMVRRELALGPAAVDGEATRLKALLEHDGSVADLEAALCEAIAGDRIAPADPALIDHL